MNIQAPTVAEDVTTYRHYIDGEYVDPAGGEWFDSVDPYRNEVWARIPRGTAEDVDRAVQAAKRAMTEGPWAKTNPSARGKLMRRLGDLVAANAERLHAAVFDLHETVGEVNDAAVVSREDEGRLQFFVDLLHEPKDADASLLVEVCRRLVGQHDPWRAGEGAGNRHALALATR